MPEIKLSKSQLNKMKADMNVQEEMLTDGEVNAIALQVNSVINLPFLNEEKELIVIGKAVRWVDQKLYQILPNEYYELIKGATDGVSKSEAAQIEDRLSPLINDHINIPVLSEKQEEKLISLILGIIINAMVKGVKLEEVQPN